MGGNREHYDTPRCGGIMIRSGKGEGPRYHGTRFQKVMVFPGWNRHYGRHCGVDAYFSSRCDEDWQIFDHFWSPKTVADWLETKTEDWVFIQEIAFDEQRQEFDWERSKTYPSMLELKTELREQREAHGRMEQERKSRAASHARTQRSRRRRQKLKRAANSGQN